jgi:DNA-directed RNA polymerase sigma subunit (sigma70/sigma32)
MLVSTFPGTEPGDMVESCALDVADRGEHTLNEVGEMLGVSRERVRQIEEQALRKLATNPATRRQLK